jgi:hypothetical protein
MIPRPACQATQCEAFLWGHASQERPASTPIRKIPAPISPIQSSAVMPSWPTPETREATVAPHSGCVQAPTANLRWSVGALRDIHVVARAFSGMHQLQSGPTGEPGARKQSKGISDHQRLRLDAVQTHLRGHVVRSREQ